MGSAQLDDGEFAAAEKELRKARELGYSSDAITPVLARLLVARGDYKRAIEEFAWAEVQGAKAKAELQTAVGQAYLGTDYTSVARDRFAAALVQQPDYPQALVGQARVTAIGGDFAKALAMVETALEKSPALPEAWQFKGDILSGQGQAEPALAAYRKALDVKPDYLPAHSVLLSTLIRQGKVDDASRQLAAMQKIAPKHPETLYWAALLAYQQKNLAVARDAIQNQLALTPDNVRGLVLAGRIHNRLGSYARAEADLLKALKSEPKQRVARMTLVDTYTRMDKSSKALEALKPLLSDAEPTADVLILAGEVYARNGEGAKAAAYFQKAATFDSKSVTQRRAAALSYLAKGENERALSELEAVAAADTGIGADLALIATLARQRKFDEALVAIAALEKKQPDSAFPHNLRGEMLVAKRDIAGARASFERALTIEGTNFPATVSGPARPRGGKTGGSEKEVRQADCQGPEQCKCAPRDGRFARENRGDDGRDSGDDRQGDRGKPDGPRAAARARRALFGRRRSEECRGRSPASAVRDTRPHRDLRGVGPGASDRGRQQ